MEDELIVPYGEIEELESPVNRPDLGARNIDCRTTGGAATSPARACSSICGVPWAIGQV